MKTSLVLFALVTSVAAFVPRPLPTKVATLTQLAGWFDFKPFHGHGSAEDDLDEQWEAQQAILRDRRSHHIDKEHLKLKYQKPDKVKFEVHSKPQQHFAFEDTYVEDDNKAPKKLKFFWEK